MSTFTATPDPATGAVDLDLDMERNTVNTITRANYYGTAPVRAADGQLPSATSGTTLISDYEASAGLNSYTAFLKEDLAEFNYATNPLPANVNGWGTSSGYVKSYEAARAGRPAMVYTKSGTGSWICYGRRAGMVGATGTSTNPGSPADVVPCTPGQTMYARLDLGTDNPTADGRVTIRFFDAAYVSITSTSGAVRDLAVNTWETFTHNAVAPAGAAWAWMEWGVGIKSGNTVGGELSWAGRAYLGPADNTYFSGDTPDTSSYHYFWDGTAYASISKKQYWGLRQITATATLDLAQPWLLVPIAPQYSEAVDTITDYSAARQTFSTVHQIIGRPDPVVVMGKLGTRKGTLEVFTASLEDAARVSRVFDRGEVVLLKQSVPGLDMYLAALSLDVAPYQVQGQDTRWKLAVEYQEVTRPPGNLAGALGWNFDALALAYPSFDAVTAAYATFDDLTLGDTR